MIVRNRHRLLVVEDNSDLLYIELKALEMAGYQVDGALDVAGALRQLDRRDYDVVITDLALPRRIGNHLIAEARERNIPCIAITAHLWDPLARAAREIGCHTLITKPFQSKQLVQAVEHLLDGTGGSRSRSSSPRAARAGDVRIQPVVTPR